MAVESASLNGHSDRAPDWRTLLFSFRGRISHWTYVTFCLAARLAMIFLLFGTMFLLFKALDAARSNAGIGFLAVLVAGFFVAGVTVLIWLSWATTVKRLHDRNWTGWLSLLSLVPLLSLWILAETVCFPGKNQNNEYGEAVSDRRESWIAAIGLGLAAIAIVYATAFAGRSLVVQPFNIPSGAQEPTLLVGDYLFVSKAAYGYSRYSFPFGIIPISGRFMASQPQRGDVVVFKFPGDNSTDYVKRIVGLPGDRVQMKDGVLYINEKPVPKVKVGDYIEDFEGTPHHVPQFRETLPNGVSYNVLDRYSGGELDSTSVFVVPEGHYFMMGDNRDNSDDSREHVGYVPFENLVGKVEFLFFSSSGTTRAWQIWRWPSDIRYERLGKLIH